MNSVTTTLTMFLENDKSSFLCNFFLFWRNVLYTNTYLGGSINDQKILSLHFSTCNLIFIRTFYTTFNHFPPTNALSLHFLTEIYCAKYSSKIIERCGQGIGLPLLMHLNVNFASGHSSDLIFSTFRSLTFVMLLRYFSLFVWHSSLNLAVVAMWLYWRFYLLFILNS